MLLTLILKVGQKDKIEEALPKNVFGVITYFINNFREKFYFNNNSLKRAKLLNIKLKY